MTVTTHRATAVLVILLLLAGCSATPVGDVSIEPAGATRTADGLATPTADVPATPGTANAPIGATETARVVRVVDGDTIIVDRGHGEERLRYIGIDTPEDVKPNTPVEFMAREAAAANVALLAGGTVDLQRDVSEVDRFNRLLRYVWVRSPSEPSGWVFVNLALVAGGFAHAVTFPPDVRYADVFGAAEEAAREQHLGLWAAQGSAPLPLTGGGSRPGCDPSYPDVCIPPGPPDLDCRDVPYAKFRVLPPDPHQFDGNHDGVGCEGPP